MGKNLKAIRADIFGIKEELAIVAQAIQPLDELEAELRAYLGGLASKPAAFVDTCVSVLNHGLPVLGMVDANKDILLQRAFSFALAGYGVERIISEAKAAAQAQAQAQEQGTKNLRMTKAEKGAKLQELRERLYSLELDEEFALDGAERRLDATPAAVIGVPLEQAIDAGLLPRVRGI